MGHWEREVGTITLPTAELPRLRKALQTAEQARRDTLLAGMKKLWSAAPAAQKKSDHAFGAWAVANHHLAPELFQANSFGHFLSDDARDLSWTMSARGPVKSPTKAMLGEPVTNRTETFRAGSATVTFDREKSTVTWDVREERNSIERSRESAVGKAFFSALFDLRWTRQTGGVIYGTNEYAVEASTEYGSNPNSVSYALGPIGEQEEPMQFTPWLDTKGVWHSMHNSKVRKDYLERMFGGPGRVSRGVPAGGQFTSRNRSESSVRL